MKSNARGEMERVTEKRMRQYAKDRDAAIIAFLETGDEKPFFKMAKKYGLGIPSMECIRIGMYCKTAQYCPGIPVELRRKAAEMCIALGMEPCNPELGEPLPL